MKKKFILFFTFLFLFITNVNADSINGLNMFVDIDENGIVNVKEEYTFTQNYISKFKDSISTYATDFKVYTDNNEYTFLNKKSSKNNSFYINKYSNNQILIINGETINNKLFIEYKVDNTIFKLNDRNLFNYVLINNKYNHISNLNVYVSAPFQINENNLGLYLIGGKLSYSFEDNTLHLYTTNINKKANIRLLLTFNGYEFTKAKELNQSFDDYFHVLQNEQKFLYKLKNNLKKYKYIIIVFVILIILIIILLRFLLNENKLKEYKNIKSYNNYYIDPELNNHEYYDALPFKGDLFKIYFFGCYYGIIKEKQSIIGSILIKWIYEGKADIITKNDRKLIKLENDLYFERDLELELYEILSKISKNLEIDTKNFNIFLKDNQDLFIEWYKHCNKQVIELEQANKNIKIKGKKMYLNKYIYDESEKIIGLKRYLMNFNQVPRLTKLNEEVYKYLLIVSIMLNVDKNLASEILRKNKDNIMALILSQFYSLKSIYKSVFNGYNFNKIKKDEYLPK